MVLFESKTKKKKSKVTVSRLFWGGKKKRYGVGVLTHVYVNTCKVDKVRDLHTCNHVRNSCVERDKKSSSQVRQFVFADSSNVATADYLIFCGYMLLDTGNGESVKCRFMVYG